MSLRMLFDEATVGEMMTAWPAKPALHTPPDDSRVRSIVTAELINTYLDTGTAPADQLIVIKDGAALHSRAYTTDGYVDPGKIAKWRGRGYTIQLRNLHRWCPAVHAICSAIQNETGYGSYATGFVTPPSRRAGPVSPLGPEHGLHLPGSRPQDLAALGARGRRTTQ